MMMDGILTVQWQQLHEKQINLIVERKKEKRKKERKKERNSKVTLSKYTYGKPFM
jgi:hypothetical protein